MGGRASAPERVGHVPPQAPPLPPSIPPRAFRNRGLFSEKRQQRVTVVVLGDVGRSPRMQYHAMSLASHKVRVSMVGYTGERCIHAVEHNPRVTLHRFDPPLSRGRVSRRLKRSAYVVFAVAKALALTTRLLYELIYKVPRPDVIIVQNPPSLPGLACVWLACWVRGCTMVLDWHNLGFTMFGRGPRHPLVWVTRKAEGFFGRQAGVNIAVSHAMRNWIKQYFGIPEAYVVYDQPPDIFGPPTLQERHELFKKLVQTTPDFRKAALAYTNALDAPTGELYNGNSAQALATLAPAAAAAADNSAAAVMATTRASLLAAAGSRVNSAIERLPDANGEERGTLGRENNDNSEQAHGQKRKKDHEPSSRFVEEKTLFTTRSATGEYALRRDRPALLVSSTSWTPDEDFSVLLDAVARLESRAASGAAPSLPFVVVVVTGKGPEKARYVERMRAMRLSRIALCTAWLDPEDYPVLLGSADLGISLHTSTSGVDLPMKVVDMFGCGVPVCAVHFECLKELVQDGYNGCVFKDSKQLALQLEALLEGFPRAGCELEGYRSNVRDVKRWKEHWDEFAWPHFSRLIRAQSGGSRAARNAAGSIVSPAEGAAAAVRRRQQQRGSGLANNDPPLYVSVIVGSVAFTLGFLLLWIPMSEKKAYE